MPSRDELSPGRRRAEEVRAELERSQRACKLAEKNVCAADRKVEKMRQQMKSRRSGTEIERVQTDMESKMREEIERVRIETEKRVRKEMQEILEREVAKAHRETTARVREEMQFQMDRQNKEQDSKFSSQSDMIKQKLSSEMSQVPTYST